MAGLLRRAAPAYLAVSVVVTAVGAVTPVVAAWLTKTVLDRVAAPDPVVPIGSALGLAGCAAVVTLMPQLAQFLRAEIDRRVGVVAKDELFTAVERFSGLARFEDPVFLDRLRLAEQGAAGPGLLADSVLTTARTAATAAGLVGSLAVVSPWFTVLALAAAVPALLVELRLSRYRMAVLWRISPTQRRELFYTRLLGTIDAAKEIRLLGLGGFLRGRMVGELRRANAERGRVDRRELAVQSALVLLAAGLYGTGLVWAVRSAADGRLTVGDVAMFVAAVAGVQAATAGLVAGSAAAHQQLLLFRHFLDVVDGAPDLPVAADPVAVPPLRRGIELTDVWFRYADGHPWVLRGVDLFIPHGAAVALVGRNGCGKSTLVKLLCRFYDPTRGTIRWDGVDLRDMPVVELRSRIGAVFQDFMAYDFSAADNIGVGDLAVRDDPAALERVARWAGVHDTVSALPRGYRTLLTRMFAADDDPGTGVVLSGGQWQRLRLARALLRRDRDLMILDEPSSGLDAEAEYEVHTRLRDLRAGRTSVLISHRMGTVRDADLIVVLADGVVTERGTHPDLMARDGVYAALFSMQASGYAATVDR